MIDHIKSYLRLPRRVLGVALENDVAHLVEVVNSSDKRVLKNIVSLERMAEHSSDSLQRVLSKYGIRASQAILALDCRQVFFRAVEFPHMKETELLETVKWEVQRHVPYEEDTYYYDCAVLARDLASNKSTVMIAAVKKEKISSMMELFASIDIKLMAIESDIFSLARLVKSDQDYIIVSMRRQEFVVMAYQGGVPFFVRGFSLDDGQEKIASLSDAISYSLEQCNLQRHMSIQVVYVYGDGTARLDRESLSEELGITLQVLCPVDLLRYDASFAEADLRLRAMQATAAIGAVLRGDVS